MGEDVDRLRSEFFRRTRRSVAVLYVVLGLMAVGVAVAGAAVDVAAAASGAVVGCGVGLVLFRVSERIPATPRGARALVVMGAVAALVVVRAIDVDLSDGSTAAVLGAFAGFLFGAIAAIATIRRRLGRDDALLLRQRRLGFVPEKPGGWLRG